MLSLKAHLQTLEHDCGLIPADMSKTMTMLDMAKGMGGEEEGECSVLDLSVVLL